MSAENVGRAGDTVSLKLVRMLNFTTTVCRGYQILSTNALGCSEFWGLRLLEKYFFTIVDHCSSFSIVHKKNSHSPQINYLFETVFASFFNETQGHKIPHIETDVNIVA